MKDYIKYNEWLIVEEGFDPKLNRISESLFSIGNGKMGQRANFEEKYSGDSLRGSYVAGIYYPDKTRVGWWKNGYPEYFAKIINSTNWIGINITINGIELDLATAKVLSFNRVLDMQHGLLIRSFVAELPNGNRVEVNTQRFVSISNTTIGAIRFSLKALNLTVKQIWDNTEYEIYPESVNKFFEKEGGINFNFEKTPDGKIDSFNVYGQFIFKKVETFILLASFIIKEFFALVP